MNEQVYRLLRRAAIPEHKEECMGKLLEISQLDYRVLKSLIHIIENEGHLSMRDIERLLDPGFYTRRNMVMAARDGFFDIVPISYFEDEEWLKEARVNFLPIDFVKGYRKIRSFIIRPQIEIINGFAFAKCCNLERVVFADSPRDIGDYAFRDCVKLSLTELPDKVEHIGKGCFKGCSNISRLSLPDSLQYIEEEAFSNCTSLEMASSRAESVRIGNSAFEGCSSLRRLNATIKKLGKASFFGCSRLEQTELCVDEIPKKAFAGCSSLKRISFVGKTPSSIRKDAMMGCVSLKNIYSTGFSYQLRECDGYCSLVKDSYLHDEYYQRLGMEQMVEDEKQADSIFHEDLEQDVCAGTDTKTLHGDYRNTDTSEQGDSDPDDPLTSELFSREEVQNILDILATYYVDAKDDEEEEEDSDKHIPHPEKDPDEKTEEPSLKEETVQTEGETFVEMEIGDGDICIVGVCKPKQAKTENTAQKNRKDKFDYEKSVHQVLADIPSGEEE